MKFKQVPKQFWKWLTTPGCDHDFKTAIMGPIPDITIIRTCRKCKHVECDR